jgi:hypothetical protein
VQRARTYEILTAALALVLFLAAGLVHSGEAPHTPTDGPQPARGAFVGQLTQEHALAPAGGSTHHTVGKFVADAPPAEASRAGQVRAATPQTAAGAAASSVALARSVRAPPSVPAA